MEHNELKGDHREFFSTLGNLSRLAIVQLLRRHAATVSQIAETLNFEQSRVSHSLARLQRAGLVTCRWEDKRKMFHLSEDVAPVLRDIDLYLEHRTKPARPDAQRTWPNGAAWAAASSD